MRNETTTKKSRKNPNRGEEYPPKSGIKIRPYRYATGGGKYGLNARLSQIGHRSFDLDGYASEDALKAMDALHKARLEMSLFQAVDFAIQHLRPEGGEITMVEAGRRYVENGVNKRLKPESIKGRRVGVQRMAKKFGPMLMTEITPKMFDEWFDGISEMGGWQVGTKKNKRIQYGAFFRWAAEANFLASSPVKKADYGKTPWKEPVILTPKDAHGLLETAQNPEHRAMLPFFVLSLFCGIRKSELLALTWDDVHLDNEKPFVGISARIAKTDDVRNIRLSENAIAWLMTVENKTGSIAPPGPERRRREVCKDAGWRDPETGFSTWGRTRNNACRHSFGSYHYALHNDREETLRQMGHLENSRMFFLHYRQVTTTTAANAYFDITPDTVFGQLEAIETG